MLLFQDPVWPKYLINMSANIDVPSSGGVYIRAKGNKCWPFLSGRNEDKSNDIQLVETGKKTPICSPKNTCFTVVHINKHGILEILRILYIKKDNMRDIKNPPSIKISMLLNPF